MINARSEITQLVERNPGLRPRVAPFLEKVYPTVRRLTCAQTRLPLSTFPKVCPWTLAQILDGNFRPEANTLE